MGYVANPRTTFNIVTNDSRVGLDDHRALIVAQITSAATAPAGGLYIDLPRTAAEINDLLGAGSMAAMIARAFREVNPVTNVDVKCLSDNGSGTAATASLAFSGTATSDKTVYVSVVSKENHRWQLDIVEGDTAATALSKLAAVVADDRWMPFAYSDNTTTTATFTANNKGTHANDWLIMVEGTVPGLSITLTAWHGGATNPSLTTVWDDMVNIRYQTIVWPNAYDKQVLANFLDPRRNVANDVKEGRGFVYDPSAFGTIKATAAGLNSSEIVLFNNKSNTLAGWKGAHIPEAPDVLAAKFAAARALRFEDGASISAVVTTSAAKDQFGGVHTASLPYFNTEILGVGMPLKGTGYSLEEQVELENSGVSVLGVNRTGNAVIAGQVVTTYENDVAGNVDDTWKYLEWRDTHGLIREYLQRNCQKEFRQTRMTTGDGVAGFAIVTEASIRSFILLLCTELGELAIVVKGTDARQFIEKNLVVILTPGKRRAEIDAKIPMLSQLGEMIGSLKYSFEIK